MVFDDVGVRASVAFKVLRPRFWGSSSADLSWVPLLPPFLNPLELT